MQESYYWWVVVGLLVVSLVNLGLGAVVIQSGKGARNWWFLGLAVSSFAWIVTNALFATMTGRAQEVIALASYGAAAGLAMSFLGFACAFIEYKVRRTIKWAYLFTGGIIGIGSMFPDVLLVSVSSDMTLQTNTVPLTVYGLFIASSLIAGMVMLARGYRVSSGRRRQQIGIVMTGALAASGVGLLCNLIAPMLGNYSFVQLGPLGIIIFVAVTAYSIAYHGMFDVKRAVARTSMHTMSLAVLSGMYVVLAYGLSAALFGGSTAQPDAILSPLNVMLALVLVVVFQPVRQFFDKVTDNFFYRGEYDREKFFKDFGQILSFDTDLRLLLRRASGYIAEQLKAEKVYFQIIDRGVFGGSRQKTIPDIDLAIIKEYYRANFKQTELLRTDLAEDEVVSRILKAHGIKLCLPLIIKGQVIGYLLIGDHKSRGYSARDIGVIESIANELTIAISNSLAVEEIRDLNESLRQRVSEATRELKSSNRQLRHLDESKDEFLSMASHQLRTPLTSIKGYLDMILEGDLGRINAVQRSALSDAYLSSERMVLLINDFLNVSRLQTGKFTIEKRLSDIGEAFHQELQMLEVVARQRNLELDAKVDEDIASLFVDIDKLRQIIVNMIDNAIYYSQPNSKIDIRLGEIDGNLVFTVKDTGIGVPAKEQPQLFGKFFRASNARKRRPDGTGVGLFLSKKVILEHGGEVIFRSKEGEGSTFGFKIPIQAGPELK